MSHLLVVDDVVGVQSEFEISLRAHGRQVSTCDSALGALRCVDAHTPDVAIVDLGLVDGSGLQVYDLMRAKLPHLPIIVIAASVQTELAIEAMKRGAFDYLVKPVDLHRLRGVVARAIELAQLSRATASNVAAGSTADNDEEPMVGHSPAMQEVYKSIGRVASQDVTVLILGESGTGKELVARAVHRYSHRSQQPLVAINCAAIPESLLESELFGYEKGAFTGAEERRIGKFESAQGGTVFLDEIADMSSATQAKVLRLIQDQQFERVGGTQTVQTDIRVIAATNQNLAKMVAEGAFRQDLYYRVNGFTIDLPPLRRRQGDVPLLTNHFVQRFNRELGRRVRAVAPEAMHWLQMNLWPGNVRELQSTIKYAMINAAGDVLTVECFPPNPLAIEGAAADDSYRIAGISMLEKLARGLLQDDPGKAYRRLTALVDEVAVQEALICAKGNQLQAAALLGISRTTLRAKLRSMGLSIEKQVFVDRAVD